MTPFISVIVLAHDRDRFVLEAVRSAARQTLENDKYEVLVVKNFQDARLDSQIADVGAKPILCEAAPLAIKVAAGVRESRGEVIAFLEDDDLYEPTRLDRVYHEFSSCSRLGLFHNRFSYIDGNGQPIPGDQVRAFALRRVRGSKRRLVESQHEWRQSRKFAQDFPDFNLSSVAVRRAVADVAFPYFSRISATVDTLLFFAAIATQSWIVLDGSPLTRYRVHEANTTLSGSGGVEQRILRLQNFALTTDKDYRVIRDFVLGSQNEVALHLINARICVNRLTLAFRSPAARRRDFVPLFMDLMRYCDTYPVWEDVVGVVGILPFLVSPSLGRLLYQRQVSIR